MLYIIIALLVIIGILGFMLLKKHKLDKKELDSYNEELSRIKLACDMQKQENQQLNYQEKNLREKVEYEQYKLEECKKDLQVALDTYNDITENKLKDIDASLEEQRQKRQEELDTALKEKQQYYQKLLQDTIDYCDAQNETIKGIAEEKWRETTERIAKYNKSIEEAKERFESIERSLRSYDAEQQQKLFYTIQLPEEYKEDIEFLLTTVAAKVQHPDIISKLVWAEYVKPYLDDTFKRIEIKAEPGIYKLTSLQNGKSYVGKSTNVKNRIADHFKSSVGIKSIADQAVHHAILKEGFWNWLIEIITYCDKDKLNELEKYYIEFFKCQEFGYNKTGGG